MITATVLAIFVVPVLYVLIETLVERKRPAHAIAQPATESAQ